MVKRKRRAGDGSSPSVGEEQKTRPADEERAVRDKSQREQVPLEEKVGDIASADTSEVEVGKEIEKQIEEEKNLAQEYLDHLQRLQAEFANYRKRAQKELVEAYDYAKGELACKLLPVIDDLERAIESLDSNCSSEETLKGVKLIYGKLKSTLQAEGLEAIQCKGTRFDPNLHEAVVVTKVREGADNEIIKDFQKGYTFKGRLVRPSKVEVAQIESDEGDE